MPTLQEDREQYNNRIRSNMEFLLHGDTSEVAKTGLKKAQDLKTDTSETRRYSNVASSETISGGLSREAASTAEQTRPVNSVSDSASAATTVRRSNSLRPDISNYRNKFERPQANYTAAASDYDSLNSSIRNNPRPQATNILNQPIGGLRATYIEQPVGASSKAVDAYKTVSARSVQATASLTAADVVPNAVANRMVMEDTASAAPTNTTQGYRTIPVITDTAAIETAREEAIRRQKQQQAQSAATGIPTQVKVIAAVIAAAIILAFTVIFVNSALINSLNTELNQLSVTLNEVSASAASLQQEIDEATSYETISEYAEEAGMIKVG